MTEKVDITPNKDGGVLKELVTEGTGTETPPLGSKVSVHYTGVFTDGKILDSSRDTGRPFEFDLGKGNVIKGWDLGVATMKKGETSRFTIASEYAYGKNGSGSVPPDSTLIFDIEVIGWKFEDLSPQSDGSLQRRQITPGDGFSSPNSGALVDIDLVGYYEGKEFEKRSVSFPLGEGSEFDIVDGIERGLEKFKRGETSKLIIGSKYAFGETGNPNFNIPANATVEYDVTLKDFEKTKESWSMDIEEKVEQGKLFKEKGTKYFKDGKLALAVKMYKKVLSYIELEKDGGPELLEEKQQLVLSSNLNLALCYLKQQEYFEAKDAASAALELDANNEKAYFRRGQALLNIGEAEQALNDFTMVLKLEPNNKAAQVQFAACQKAIRDQLKKEKKIYANMFEKFAKMDTQVN